MSRFDTAALQQPEKPANGKGHQYPEVDIGPDNWQPQQPDQQQQKQEPAPQEQYLKNINDLLQNANQNQNSQVMTAYNQLTNDPVIAQYLQAKQQGKKVKLADDAEPDPMQQFGQQAANEPEPNWTELAADPQKFAQAMAKQAVTGTAKAMIPLIQGMFNKHLAPMGDLAKMVSGLARDLNEIQTERVNNEISTVRNQNPQLFDELRPLMQQLAGVYRNMPTNDLFNLAMLKTGKTLHQAQSSQSERPSQSTTAAPTFQSPRQQALQQQQLPKNPRAAFDFKLNSVLDNKDFSNLG